MRVGVVLDDVLDLVDVGVGDRQDGLDVVDLGAADDRFVVVVRDGHGGSAPESRARLERRAGRNVRRKARGRVGVAEVDVVGRGEEVGDDERASTSTSRARLAARQVGVDQRGEEQRWRRG